MGDFSRGGRGDVFSRRSPNPGGGGLAGGATAIFKTPGLPPNFRGGDNAGGGNRPPRCPCEKSRGTKKNPVWLGGLFKGRDFFFWVIRSVPGQGRKKRGGHGLGEGGKNQHFIGGGGGGGTGTQILGFLLLRGFGLPGGVHWGQGAE